MLAPIDKINKPGGNDIIQIIVTRACDRLCGNCTQLIPFRRDEKFMSVDVFRQALRSLDGWPGVRAMFGGNPAIHPKFADLCQIMIDEVPDQRKRGIWCNNPINDEIAKVMRDTFYPHARTNLNAHADAKAADLFDKWLPGKLIKTSRDRPSWHSSILINHADFGISDEEWIASREQCDINQDWSAGIAERDGKPYVYFCELGISLDGIRGENNGILAEPGWWQWPMERFKSQVSKCCDRGCGIPLRRLGQLDVTDTYDYSETFAPIVELTVKNRSRVKALKHDTLPVGTEKATDYQAHRTEKPL